MAHAQQAGGRARTAAYTLLALVAFAANSILCRLALRHASIDAATFSAIRLSAGAATLLLLVAWTRRDMDGAATAAAGARAISGAKSNGSWTSASMLFLYAIPFSFAYNGLSAGTGALILFGSVQATMILGALRSGERANPLQWLGLAVAVAGLVYLLLPGLAAPPLRSAALMAVAGVAWGIYSLRGRGAANPLAQTSGNFARSVPLALGVLLVARPHVAILPSGAWLAVASGALASGLGYVLWYAALRGLTAMRAAVVQLSVPVLAAAGGVLFLAESITARLVLAAAMVLGGIALALAARAPRSE
ncbi:MAG TPA: DMT family transporter [Candidatus Eisenbacteria bacterium]|nr:DMT family transporter [Candidatus Eisenbacteria bacterium]